MIEHQIESGNTVGAAAWLSSVASLVIERYIVEHRAAGADAVGGPSKAHRLRDQWRIVEPYVKSLGPRQREIVRLRFREAMCYADIAGRLDIPIGTVRSRLARARVAIDGLSRDSPNPADIAGEDRRTGAVGSIGRERATFAGPVTA